MRTLMILSGLLSCITVHVIAQVNVAPAVLTPKQHPELRNNYLTYLFRKKRFDVYDHRSHLLYSNVVNTKDGKIRGLPGFTDWPIFTGNVWQLTDSTSDNVADYTISFAGKNVALKPVQVTGILNQPLVLKEKQ